MKPELVLNIGIEYADKYGLSKDFVGKKIVMYPDRLSHIEKHVDEFTSRGIYTAVVLNMNMILQEPDFICKNEKNSSLEVIKKFGDNILIAIRISESSTLKIRTLYPINQTKYNKLKSQALNAEVPEDGGQH